MDSLGWALQVEVWCGVLVVGWRVCLNKNNFLFVVVNLYKCYLKMPMVSKCFFFEIHFLRFLVGMRTFLPIGKGPHSYQGVIFMCFLNLPCLSFHRGFTCFSFLKIGLFSRLVVFVFLVVYQVFHARPSQGDIAGLLGPPRRYKQKEQNLYLSCALATNY